MITYLNRYYLTINMSSNLNALAGVAGLSGLGYFTEIEMLQKKINDLKMQIEEERAEHRDIYHRMRADCAHVQSMYAEMQELKKENLKMAAELMEYHELKAAQVLQAAMRRTCLHVA
jgi:hypothetical protein